MEFNLKNNKGITHYVTTLSDKLTGEDVLEVYITRYDTTHAPSSLTHKFEADISYKEFMTKIRNIVNTDNELWSIMTEVSRSDLWKNAGP